MIRRPPKSTPFPSTTLFRSHSLLGARARVEAQPEPPPPAREREERGGEAHGEPDRRPLEPRGDRLRGHRDRKRERDDRSEEHTSELQSRQYLVCRLLLEKKK